eukprot:CAMPEP_0118831286 /NCGR_PEP_ID=MMETSP1162-20130426/30117_1 /TAXON_ID=33656 /ORGANISM="Phaeocystis Sp, Strain CCMP2710" /LENGTH=49 /DNA_ID=CAMNT_0006762687 /DNA_START=57 /DNA_END=206 /DNA_ORIENTATION=+
MTGGATPFQNTAGKCAADEQLGPAAVEGGRRGELLSTVGARLAPPGGGG